MKLVGQLSGVKWVELTSLLTLVFDSKKSQFTNLFDPADVEAIVCNGEHWYVDIIREWGYELLNLCRLGDNCRHSYIGWRAIPVLGNALAEKDFELRKNIGVTLQLRRGIQHKLISGISRCGIAQARVG